MGKKGRLYLIPVTISDVPVETVVHAGNLRILEQLDFFIAEEIKTTRRFLKAAGYSKKLNDTLFCIFNEHSGLEDIVTVMNLLLEGKDAGLLSESGAPCVADPGSAIVREAHKRGIEVIPLVGPSSILLALMASGFNGQNFAFQGYIPVNEHEKVRKLKELERNVYNQDQTQIFIETPYRNVRLFESIIRHCKDETMLCIACDITGKKQYIKSLTIKEWRSLKPDIHKKPVVFLMYK